MFGVGGVSGNVVVQFHQFGEVVGDYLGHQDYKLLVRGTSVGKVTGDVLLRAGQRQLVDPVVYLG